MKRIAFREINTFGVLEMSLSGSRHRIHRGKIYRNIYPAVAGVRARLSARRDFEKLCFSLDF